MTTSTQFAQISTLEITKLAESRVSRSALLIYMAISAHLRGFDGKTTAFPSIKRIMAILGGSVARSTVFQALKQLKEAGLITIQRTTERKSNTYKLQIREIIKKASNFISSQAGPKKKGPRSQTKHSGSHTQKRKMKRKSSSIDWDMIMFQWVKQGKSPSLEMIEKMPYQQKNWLKKHHPRLFNELQC